MDAIAHEGPRRAHSLLGPKESPAETAKRLDLVMPADLGLYWRNEFLAGNTLVSVKEAITALEGLARQFQEHALKFGYVRHLLAWREPEADDFRLVLPVDAQRDMVILRGEFPVHQVWADHDRNLLGYLFGGEPDRGALSSLVEQAGRWATALFSGSPIVDPSRRWLLEQHRYAWKGHPVVQSHIWTRLDNVRIPYGKLDRVRKSHWLYDFTLTGVERLPRCWYTVLEPDVCTASSQTILSMIDAIERAMRRRGIAGDTTGSVQVEPMHQPVPVQKAKQQLGDANLHAKLKRRKIPVCGPRGRQMVELEQLLTVVKPRRQAPLVRWAKEQYPPRSDW